MCIQTQTKRLAQTIFLFSAASLCAILACMAVTARHNVPAPRTANFPLYTYQNPFQEADNASSAAFSKAKAGGTVARLTSVKSFLGLSGLGMLWVVSTWYLSGRSMKKPIHRHVSVVTQVKMNPLAVLPESARVVPKEDTFRPSVFCRTTTPCLHPQRKITAPCQSRFRPVALVASQARFGRL